MISFDLNSEERSEMINQVLRKANSYHESVCEIPLTTKLSQSDILKKIMALIERPKEDKNASIELLMEALEQGCLHNSHPLYLGLFTPRVPFVAAISEFIKAVYNPNLGSWSHAPFAVESEAFLIKELGERFGYPKGFIDGVFTTGGADGNMNGILCALNYRYKDLRKVGLSQLGKKPVLYCSMESHHSIVKAARMVGVGDDSIRFIEQNQYQRIDVKKLEAQISKDISRGFDPFMIISTAGTTGSGAIDPLQKINQLAVEFGLWHHVDAAYGGALVFHDTLKSQLSGIGMSDSISVDMHKWPASPVGANVFLTRNTDVLHELFAVNAGYMPEEESTRFDPYAHSSQWSRRYIGLSFLAMLVVYGWEGYSELIDRQWKLGKYLKLKLVEYHWEITNQTELPIVCFTHPTIKHNPSKIKAIVNEIVDSGQAWISTYEVNNQLCMRACITNYDTEKADVDRFVNILSKTLETIDFEKAAV